VVVHTLRTDQSCFAQVIVTSDNLEILDIITATNIVAVHRRPARLATDTSKVIDTVAHYFDLHTQSAFDQIWLCLPTCPLRTDADIRVGISSLDEDVDGVVSVTAFEFPPSLALKIEDQLLTGATSTHPFASGNSRSQDHEAAYRPNGGFYGMWWNSFDRFRNFYRGKIRPIVMPRERSIDVDTEWDFQISEFLLNLRRAK